MKLDGEMWSEGKERTDLMIQKTLLAVAASAPLS